MAERWIDDGGDNTTGLSWATAYPSIQALMAAEPTFITTSDNVVYFGHDSDGAPSGGTLTVTGPASGNPVRLISLQQGTSNYLKGTGKQINTTDGAYHALFDGSLALYGIRVAAGGPSGGEIRFNSAVPKTPTLVDCTLSIGANASFIFGANATRLVIRDLVIDLTADGTVNPRAGVVIAGVTGVLDLVGLTFINPGQRNSQILRTSTSCSGANITGADFSGFVNVSAISTVGEASTSVNLTNCLFPAAKVPFSTGTRRPGAYFTFTNAGPGDAPTALMVNTMYGDLVSSPSIYRDEGAMIEGDPSAWLITTTNVCGESTPFYLPYLYGTIDSTGSKTFDVFLTNDVADLTDAEAWLELEYLATADSPLWSLASDQRATIMTTPAAQEDDTISTWTGTGPAFTYRQRLRVTAVVGEAGMYRARVVFGKASIASSAFLYVDPLVVVS